MTTQHCTKKSNNICKINGEGNLPTKQKDMKKLQTDKLAHFGIGGLVCAMVTIVAMLQEGVIGWGSMVFPIIGDVVVFIISYMKEKIVDDEFTWADILAAMIGCIFVHVSVFIGVVFNLLSV